MYCPGAWVSYSSLEKLRTDWYLFCLFISGLWQHYLHRRLVHVPVLPEPSQVLPSERQAQQWSVRRLQSALERAQSGGVCWELLGYATYQPLLDALLHVHTKGVSHSEQNTDWCIDWVLMRVIDAVRETIADVNYCLLHSVHNPHQHSVDTPVCLPPRRCSYLVLLRAGITLNRRLVFRSFRQTNQSERTTMTVTMVVTNWHGTVITMFSPDRSIHNVVIRAVHIVYRSQL